MKIALIGYGKMGQAIGEIAKSRGHEIVSIIDIGNPEDIYSASFKSADVAIEFTVPSQALSNYRKCFEVGVPVVSGTTGWIEQINEVKKACENGSGFFYASNFSLGVNVFFRLNRYLAQIMDKFSDYNVSVSEVHHTQKLDAPSGTAITLAEDILAKISRKNRWVNEPSVNDSDLYIESIREGAVPGIHDIKYESDVDEIVIHHSAKSRHGFALGAVIAAEFMANKAGFYGMDDLLKL